MIFLSLNAQARKAYKSKIITSVYRDGLRKGND